ncbi:aminotransferase class I/II-fold pyridoxal phosphate-dependent enzyme [Spiroplasma litorale]|uniref:aminotransferase class I/II-fold pyridoxal phosphate-dependent enzyme n=1 Tax=Spiroplasma litorale TaxID=216942 RepID=UPI0009465A73|nr:aminotransferase class I/II-fold pyridoxal phosphate-dependent enzyme [Spiroplasma litorale]
MKYNFDIKIDRTKDNDMHWNKEYLSKKYNIDINKPIYSFWMGDADFPMPGNVIDALKNRAGVGIFGYSFLSDNWYKSIVEWNKEFFNVDVKTEDIIYAQDTLIALSNTINAFTSKGDSIIVTTPVFGPFEDIVKNTDRSLIVNKLIYKNKKFEIDYKAFEEQIIKNKVKLFIFCNPHNPGGSVWKESDLQKILDICKKHNVFIFSDEVHRDFVYNRKDFKSFY